MIGKLDQQVILQSLTETNSFGELTQSWTTVATVWAQVMEARGQEAFESARVNASETVRIKIRYRTDITDKWRIVWQSQNYSVTHIDRTERRDGYMFIMGKVTGAL